MKRHPFALRGGRLLLLCLGLSLLPSNRVDAAGWSGWTCPLAGPLLPYLPPECCPGFFAEPSKAIELSDPPTPVVQLRVRVPASNAPGEPIEYRITLKNTSAADAHHVIVKNPLPANAKFVRASPEPHAKEPEIQWRLGTMKAGGGCEITLLLQPTNNEDVRNCARVQFEHGQCVTTRVAGAGPTTQQPTTKDPTTKEPTTKEPPIKEPMVPEDTAQLSLSIDGPAKQYANLATRYFVTVTNKGKAAATNLLVDVTLADKTTFIAASDEGKFLVNKVAWLLGTLEAGGTRTMVLTVRSQILGEQCQKATALADKGVRAVAEMCTLFGGVSAVSVEMSDTEDPIAVGGDTIFPITVRNPGSAPVTNLRVAVFVPDGLMLTRARGPGKGPPDEPVPGGKILTFDPLPNLPPGNKVDFEIHVRGGRPGDYRFRIELRADQLEGGPVIEQESTRVFAENGVQAEMQSRRKSQPTAYEP